MSKLIKTKIKKNKKLEIIKKIDNLNFKKIFMVIFYIILCLSLSFNIINYIKKPKTVEKKVIVNKEIIKYVEKQGKTKTSNFIVYLNSRIDPVTAKIIAKAVDESSKKYLLPRKLVLSIIKKESFFNPLAKSHKDCIGLMQVNPKSHPEKVKGIQPTHLYHIGINVEIGCRIFREYFNKENGDLAKTFHAYLGKRATKQEAIKYKNDILYTFAKLEMYEYIGQEKEKKIKLEKEIKLNVKNGKNNIHNISVITVKPNDGMLQESD